MTDPVVRAAEGVTLIGGGAVNAAALSAALAIAPVVVAADGGADEALRHGLIPEAVIGDFDSLSDAARARLPEARLHHVAEQDSTDFSKCLTRIEAPFVLAVGFTGRRLDHTLAALTTLAARPGPPCLMLASEEVVFAAPATLSIDLPAGTRVSLYPLGPASGRSTGLRWPIDGIDFSPAGRVGTSNEALGPVGITMSGPMLILLPLECLGAAITALGLVRADPLIPLV